MTKKVSKSESQYEPLSQSANVKRNNLSTNSQIGLELLTYFVHEYVNYLCIDFYCVGKWEMYQEVCLQVPMQTHFIDISLGDHKKYCIC